MEQIKRGRAQVVSDDLTRVWADLRDGAYFGSLFMSVAMCTGYSSADEHEYYNSPNSP